MARIALDTSIERQEVEGLTLPLGSRPAEPYKPVTGFSVRFEAADGASDFMPGDDWDEWPDRFAYDILISAKRVRSLCRALFSMLPGRFYPILDVLGNDAYREVDPYIAYELVGAEKFYDALKAFEEWFFEDGLVGFGALSVDPFFYVFVDEHKIVTVRVTMEQKEKLEQLLGAFGLTQVEEIKGLDSVEHEHRGVLVTPEDKPELFSADEVIERLRDWWALELNIDTATNLDADGNDLGVTAWQCIVRCMSEEPEAEDAYAEVLLSAAGLGSAEQAAMEAVSAATPKGRSWSEVDVIRADRILPEQLGEWLGPAKKPDPKQASVHDFRWLSGIESGAAQTPPHKRKDE